MDVTYSCLSWLDVSEKRLLETLSLPCTQENGLLRIDSVALLVLHHIDYVSGLPQMDAVVISSPWLRLERNVHPLDAARFLTASVSQKDSNIFTADFISFLKNLIVIIGEKEGIEFRNDFIVENEENDEKLRFHHEHERAIKIKVQHNKHDDLDLYNHPYDRTQTFSSVKSFNYAKIYFGIGVHKSNRALSLIPDVIEVRNDTWRDRITEICIAMAFFDIPTYVLLDIVDGLPFIFVEKQLPKIQHIHRCLQTIENVRLQRFDTILNL